MRRITPLIGYFLSNRVLSAAFDHRFFAQHRPRSQSLRPGHESSKDPDHPIVGVWNQKTFAFSTLAEEALQYTSSFRKYYDILALTIQMGTKLSNGILDGSLDGLLEGILDSDCDGILDG
jgi:hypothetical protein